MVRKDEIWESEWLLEKGDPTAALKCLQANRHKWELMGKLEKHSDTKFLAPILFIIKY